MYESKVLLPLFFDDELHIEEILTRKESLEKVREAVEHVNEDDVPTILEELKICDLSATFVENPVNKQFRMISQSSQWLLAHLAKRSAR